MQFADREELAKRQKRRAKQRISDIIWNSLTGLVLIATAAMLGVILLVFANPQSSINPYPPPTLPALVVLSTSTATPVRLPATWTPAPKPTETPRPSITATVESTATPAPESTSASPTAYPTINNGDYPYALEGQPVAMANIVFHPDSTCQWQGVAGKVVDLQGKHVVGLLLKLSGTYNGHTIEMTTISGGASKWYGDSGYEFVLGNKPVDSRSTLAVQVLDQSLQPISARVVFDTFSTCDKNLVLINFKQIR